MGRGPHGTDVELFDATHVPALRTACAELSWLLARGYAETSALALVGDRHRLRSRQRTAVCRGACTNVQRQRRQHRRQPMQALAGAELAIDGFNCVITVEAALDGGVLFRGRDGALRDLASVHGSYRRVASTDDALARLIAQIARPGPARVCWWLDRPVSNSGRLAQRIRDQIAISPEPNAATVQWEIVLDYDPDQRLREHQGLIASSDGAVLDGCDTWIDLVGAVVAELPTPPWCVVLATEEDELDPQL